MEEIRIIKRNYPGSLSQVLHVLYENKINMTSVETTIMNREKEYQNVIFNITVTGNRNEENLKNCLIQLKERYELAEFVDEFSEVPCFPRNMKDMEDLGGVLLNVKDEVNQDHKQFKDPEYRKRRDYIAEVGRSHKAGQPIPKIEYTKQEVATWRHIYNKVTPYHKSIFVKSFESNMEKLRKNCGLGPDNIPQLQDISEFLKSETGFILKPVSGILSQREFLNALAHKVFCCTQYIRHHETPEYTPEPDIIHELLGHAPMFADPQFAQLSQEIGLLTLGASDEQIERMGALYWYTIEFGSVKEDGVVKPYSAGIAGSFKECENYICGKPKFKHLDPFKQLITDYPIQDVQSTYYYNNSLQEAHHMILKFGQSMRKPMKCYYDNTSKSVKTDRKIVAVETQQVGPLF